MATSLLFHHNVHLLTQQVPPSDEFKKHFREGMFDKPNTAGFLHISHYLLTTYDAERFKKLIEWPVTCKKTEAKYRNNVKTLLTTVSTENRDINFPNILVSHLFHASGKKFVIIMLKLSQVVLRKYISSTIWKNNLNTGLNYIQIKNLVLKDTEQLSHKLNNIVLSNSNDIKMLDAKQFQRIDYLELYELIPHDVHSILFQLYKNDKLDLHNFILLFNSVVTRIYQELKLSALENLSECQLQVEASCTDITEALNKFQIHSEDIKTMTLDIQQTLCHILQEKNILQIYDDAEVPMTNDVLLMSSPIITIDTSCTDIEADLHKHLQLTPVEAVHRPLFSRYEHLKQNYTTHRSKLRGNLLGSHINFNDTMSPTNSENSSLRSCPMSSKKKLLSCKQAEKYSRLFSTRTKRNNNAGNTSVMSIPCNSKANSTAIANMIEEMQDISELSLNMSTKNLCDNSVEFTTPVKLTITKYDKSEDVSELEDMVNMLGGKSNVPCHFNICETIKAEFISNHDKIITQTERDTETKQKRRSISDLVERYKKLLERSNHTPSRGINYTKHGNE
ncbi:HAUS augmin-like complex subunit 6 [Dufourea novaeangliae]|uniref:HAUS augmin-like complex subunit 6 n=1 Tax=Dufourea novaeangliae TaxID=178035 RepID=A0A154PM22_DUFNO|nr:HAUS augmin-like complex subunit 6 [Dufourea novaeangliae]